FSLAAAVLHRDLQVPAPAWVREGVCACLEAAGRTGKGADTRHPALAPILMRNLHAQSETTLDQLTAVSPREFYGDDGPRWRAMAWGYVHLMRFGRGPLPTLFKRWRRELERATGRVPPFPTDKVKSDVEELRKHARRRWEG
ncbi:MAG: hypothetical protein ACE5JG_11890, partial [Planctomycetota bacterium]